MVKLFFVGVFYKRENNSITQLKTASDLTSFGFFQRNSVSEFMKFTAKTVVERCEPSSRTSIKQQEYICHTYMRADRLCGVVLSDADYPNRVAHTLITKILDEFAEKVPAEQWPNGIESRIAYTKLDYYLAQYQNPKEADAMTKIQNDLDDTKIILHNTINDILQRGEKLDNLVAKSDELSMQSKVFYKTARKTNQCCQLY